MQSGANNKSRLDRFVIGKIGRPHGVKGEVRVAILTDYPERFEGMTEVFIADKLTKIDHLRYQGNGLVIGFDGINDRDAAKTLTGKLLYVDRANAVPLEEGEYYAADIIGLAVIDAGGKPLGKISDIFSTGSNDVYVVAQENGAELLVPALKSVITDISLEAGTMTVKLPEVVE